MPPKSLPAGRFSTRNSLAGFTRKLTLCFITFAVLLFPNIVGGLIFIGQGFYRKLSLDGTVEPPAEKTLGQSDAP